MPAHATAAAVLSALEALNSHLDDAGKTSSRVAAATSMRLADKQLAEIARLVARTTRADQRRQGSLSAPGGLRGLGASVMIDGRMALCTRCPPESRRVYGWRAERTKTLREFAYVARKGVCDGCSRPLDDGWRLLYPSPRVTFPAGGVAPCFLRERHITLDDLPF